MDEEIAEGRWVRTSGQTNVVNVIVGVCYRPPDQEKVDGDLLQTTRRSLVFTGPGPRGGL